MAAFERDPAVAQAQPRPVADDEVVEDGDVEQAPGRDGLGGEMEVVRARGRVPGGMVVDEDEPRGVQPDPSADVKSVAGAPWTYAAGRVQDSDQARQQLDEGLPNRSCRKTFAVAASPFTASCAPRAGRKVL